MHYTDNVKAYLLCSFRNKLLDAFQSLRPMEVIEECHEFFPMGEEIINSLFKKDDVDVKNERRLATGNFTSFRIVSVKFCIYIM